LCSRSPRRRWPSGTPTRPRCLSASAPSPPGVRSHCLFVQPFIHFTLDSLRYLVPLIMKRQCDRALSPPSDRRPRWGPQGPPPTAALAGRPPRRGAGSRRSCTTQSAQG
jgi:hypothetical protein